MLTLLLQRAVQVAFLVLIAATALEAVDPTPLPLLVDGK